MAILACLDAYGQRHKSTLIASVICQHGLVGWWSVPINSSDGFPPGLLPGGQSSGRGTLREWVSGLPPKPLLPKMNRPILSSCGPQGVLGRNHADYLHQAASLMVRPGGVCGCVPGDGRCIGGLWVNAGHRGVSAGSRLLQRIGIGHVDPDRRCTGDCPSGHPVAEPEHLPGYSRMSLLSASSDRPATQGTACRGKPSRSGPQCGGRMARSRRRFPAVYRSGAADSQPAADIPSLSPQFPASDLKSPLHRGHRDSCVRRPYSAPCGPECRYASGVEQS